MPAQLALGSGHRAGAKVRAQRDIGLQSARVGLSPVPTGTGRLFLAVIGDVTEDLPRADLGDLARAAAAAGQARRAGELLDRVAGHLMILTVGAGRRRPSPVEYPATLGGYMADFVTCQPGDQDAVLPEPEA